MVFNLDLRNSRFNGRFLGLSGSPKYIRFSSSICSGRVTLGINGTGFLQAECRSCQPINGVKALKRIQITDPMQPEKSATTSRILSGPTAGMLKDETLLALRRLSDTNTSLYTTCRPNGT